MTFNRFQLFGALLALVFCLFGFRVYGADACGTQISDDLVYARLAAWVYREAPALPEHGLPDDMIEGGWETWLRNREKSGLDWSLFINKRDRKVVLAFRGTDQWVDLIGADLTGVITPVPVRQYTEAAGKARQVRSLIGQFDPGLRLILTGHSLGGGLAQYAGAVNHMEAVTFNPAWVSRGTLQWGCGNSLCDVSHIRNYLYSGDWVGMIQESVYLGSRYRLKLIPSNSDIVRLVALVGKSGILNDPVGLALLQSDAPILPPLGTIIIVGSDSIAHNLDDLIAGMEAVESRCRSEESAKQGDVPVLTQLSLEPDRDPAVISSDYLALTLLPIGGLAAGPLVYSLQVRNNAASKQNVRVRVGGYLKDGEQPTPGRGAVQARIAAGDSALIELPLRPPRNPGRYRATIILEGQPSGIVNAGLPDRYEPFHTAEVAFEVVAAGQLTGASPSRPVLKPTPSVSSPVVAPNEDSELFSSEDASSQQHAAQPQYDRSPRGGLEGSMEALGSVLDTIGTAAGGLNSFLESLFGR